MKFGFWSLALFSVAQMGATAALADPDNLHGLGRTQPGSAQTSFTRMFPDLPPFAEATDSMRDKVKELGRAGGILDAQDNLSDPIQSVVNPGVFSPLNPDNPTMTAGVTFFGQFLDHDITLDPKSPLLRPANPRLTTNFRTPAFDLDSLYGGGPEESAELYDLSSGDILFRVEAIPGSEAVSRKGATRYDLPRDDGGVAILAEGRNDENTIISQFHLAMLRFHNAVSAGVRAEQPDWPAEKVFAEAQRLVRWHYQWIIVNEFLPATIGQQR
ncbi:MAG TPA: peroxidase family protein, partial [Burkholderiales bacterium]|nr:peroxidase family protein [Burkholderiales bacterium]